MIDYDLPREVRWGFYSLEEWSRGAVAHIRALEERIEELEDEVEGLEDEEDD